MNKRALAVVAAVVVIVLLVSLVYFTKVHIGFAPPQSVHSRVVSVVKDWAGLKSPPVDSDQLATLWSSASDPYNQIGAQKLDTKLHQEFSTPPLTAKCITVNSLLTRISTVGALATAVGGCPE